MAARIVFPGGGGGHPDNLFHVVVVVVVVKCLFVYERRTKYVFMLVLIFGIFAEHRQSMCNVT
jgi:hypothetical protein